MRKDPTPWRPSFIRVGYDLAKAGQSIFEPDFFGQSASAEVDFNMLFLATEFGYEERSFPASNYSSQGTFFRVGVDANMIRYDQSKNVITFNVRYGRSSYRQQMMINRDDEFGQRAIDVSESGLKAQWFEAGLGLKVRIWKELFAGYDFNLRFGGSFDDDGEILPFYIPGYGQAYTGGRDKRGLVLGFKYSIYWTFKLRDKPVPIRPIKPPKSYNSPLEEDSGGRPGNSFGQRNF